MRIANCSETLEQYSETYCSSHHQIAWNLLFPTILHPKCFEREACYLCGISVVWHTKLEKQFVDGKELVISGLWIQNIEFVITNSGCRQQVHYYEFVQIRAHKICFSSRNFKFICTNLHKFKHGRLGMACTVRIQKRLQPIIFNCPHEVMNHKLTFGHNVSKQTLMVTPQWRSTSPKFILAILVFLCLGHAKTKENQTNSEPQKFISEPQNFV